MPLEKLRVTVSYNDCGTCLQDHLFFVMEFMSGGDLLKLLYEVMEASVKNGRSSMQQKSLWPCSFCIDMEFCIGKYLLFLYLSSSLKLFPAGLHTVHIHCRSCLNVICNTPSSWVQTDSIM
jgi:hypothetical protein